MTLNIRVFYVALAYPVRLVVDRPAKPRVGFDGASHEQLCEALQNTHINRPKSHASHGRGGDAQTGH
jgi:hypothetical protein